MYNAGGGGGARRGGGGRGGALPEGGNDRARAPRDRDTSITHLLAGLRLGHDPPLLADEDDMLIHHQYSWFEAVPPAEEAAGANVRLKRLSIDILLPGPTTLAQVRGIVSDNGRVFNFTYRLPETFLSANRTAVRLAGHTFGPRGIPHVQNTISAASRVQAHRTVLEQARVDASQKVYQIQLPFECDRQLCRRDDWGRDNHCQGLEIGMYRHEDADMQANNQLVWILHVELTAKERPNVAPASPAGYNNFSGHA